MTQSQYSSNEVDLIELNEKELFGQKFPLVGIARYNAEGSDVHQRLGTRVKQVFRSHILWVRADYDRAKKIRELKDGVYIKTNRITVKFCCRELRDGGLTGPNMPKAGDKIVFPIFDSEEEYEILSVEYEDFIPGVHVPLHLTAIIDLEHRWSSE